MVQEEAIKKVQEYLDIVVAAGVPIEKAFLFGSYARGQQKADSDIDILLISKKIDEEDDNIVGLIWKLTKNVDTKIEPYTMGLKKFNKKDVSPLLHTIKTEGIQLM